MGSPNICCYLRVEEATEIMISNSFKYIKGKEPQNQHDDICHLTHLQFFIAKD